MYGSRLLVFYLRENRRRFIVNLGGFSKFERSLLIFLEIRSVWQKCEKNREGFAFTSVRESVK